MKIRSTIQKLVLGYLFIVLVSTLQFVHGQKTIISVKTLSYITAVDISPDGKTMLTGGTYLSFTPKKEGRINLWDIKQRKFLKEFKVGKNVIDLCFTPGGKKIIVATDDDKIREWDIATGKMSKLIATTKSQPREVRFSKDGSKLLIVDRFHAAVLSAKNYQPIATFDFKKWTFSGAFSGNGKRIAVTVDTKVQVWDIQPKKLVQTTFPAHQKFAFSVAHSPKQALAITGSGDKTAVLWNLNSGKAVHTLSHDNEVYTVAFSPDGTKMATGCGDFKVRIWDVKTGKLLTTYSEHQGSVKFVKFSSDGRYVTSYAGKKAKVWALK
ncbi:hypothetical protein BKI52_32245 [marine bacterium AO1-C]|nr:hypothetical protein BKI52_32245 [marine bacterium AO1-C]